MDPTASWTLLPCCGQQKASALQHQRGVQAAAARRKISLKVDELVLSGRLARRPPQSLHLVIEFPGTPEVRTPALAPFARALGALEPSIADGLERSRAEACALVRSDGRPAAGMAVARAALARTLCSD